jgi:hypothetical protein
MRRRFSPQLGRKQFYADDLLEGGRRIERVGSYWMPHPGLPMHL